MAAKTTLARNLRWVREITFNSQTECARVMGVQVGRWCHWEKGIRRPDPDVMARFCVATGVTLDFLYRSDLRGVAEDVAFHLLGSHPELLLPRSASAGRARVRKAAQSTCQMADA